MTTPDDTVRRQIIQAGKQSLKEVSYAEVAAAASNHRDRMDAAIKRLRTPMPFAAVRPDDDDTDAQ